MPITQIHTNQIVNQDGTAVANASNVGKFRYYTDANFSYLECCMASNGTFEWILISQQAII